MGFSKYAKASIVEPGINRAGWDEIRQAAVGATTTVFSDRKAAQLVLQTYDPAKYLLSHCTIIASVDTESPGMPAGAQMFDGVQINRKYPDFYITTGTSKYVNNNNDCWERKLLLASFKTFIGAENYVEHIQIPELSKGKIIDAAARDIGDSIYVDILVATDRKHKELISAITNRTLTTLSMGCHVGFTICTKCGNVAEDELQLCRHIKYQKGNFFLDPMGKRRKIAELCGHIDEEPNSVRFIEGSWVANPAFTGAVLRNILDPATAAMADATRRKIQVAFSEPARVSDPRFLQKAARLAPIGTGAKAIPADHLAYLYDGPALGALHTPPPFSADREAEAIKASRLGQIQLAQQDFPGEGEPAKEEPAKEESSPLKKVIDDLHKTLVEEVAKSVREDLAKGESGKVRDVLNENTNDSLIKSSLQYPKGVEREKLVMALVKNPSTARNVLAGMILHDRGGWEAVGQAKRFSGREILVMSRLLDRMTKRSSMAGDSRIYRTVIEVGGPAAYPDVNHYLSACRKVIGRALVESEKAQLLEKGKLFSLGL